MSDAAVRQPILQRFELGAQWPTIDPFLFVAHHNDAYPAGNDDMGPAADLTGRNLGMDFAEIDGWNMYHGRIIPGFPQHPHRGFETITHVRHGYIDHADSLGATARFSRGDTQWMTAGAGIVHAEMFPLRDRSAPNRLQLFQIWLNLPRADKLVDPYFTMLWDERTPQIALDGAGSELTVVAGSVPGLDGTEPLSPPPNSWAARAEADVAIWHLRLVGHTTFVLPPAAGADTRRALYVFEGDGLSIEGDAVVGGAEVDAGQELTLAAAGPEVECLLLQGRPIGEPVAQYGPFVMNDRAGIEQTFADYQRTGFGGWPWPSDDPVHARDADRFARHADGHEETPGNLG